MRKFILNTLKFVALAVGFYLMVIYFHWISMILFIIYAELIKITFEFIKFMEMDLDIYKDIDQSKDKKYLLELDKYVDMSISGIGKDSDIIRTMKARSFKMTVEAYEQKQFDDLMTMKKRIKNRINYLNNTNEEI